MAKNISNDKAHIYTSTQQRIVRGVLYVSILILLAVTAVIPGALRLMYRADAQVALGHAKSVRMAFRALAAEQYGSDSNMFDIYEKGGVSAGLYDEIIQLSGVDGDFQVLLADKEDTYSVKRFMYEEGEFTVYYDSDTSSYTVYRKQTLIEP